MPRDKLNAKAAAVRAATSGAAAGASAAASAVSGGSGGTGTISINHAQVTAEVRRLNDIANDLSTIHLNAQSALRNMDTFWNGAAANAFTAGNERWRRELRVIEQEIHDIAFLIQRIADEIRDAEQRAQAAITNF